MICPKCNTPNDNNSQYCKHCALPLSEYYEATHGFNSSVSKPPVYEEVKPAEEIKVYPKIPEQTKISDQKEKGTGIVWLLMWEMMTWILWFYLNNFVWAQNFSGDENPHHYVNILNLCSVLASIVAVIISIIVLARTKKKREKRFLSIYFIVRMSLLLIFAYRFVIDSQMILSK